MFLALLLLFVLKHGLYPLSIISVLLAIFFLRGALPRYRIDSFIRLIWQSVIFITFLWLIMIFLILLLA